MLNIVQNPSITRISFASNSKFKTCLLKEGGMSKSSDLSIVIKPRIENLPKIGVVNVHGGHGTGKTTLFSTMKHIHFDHEILKSKERTCDFMDMMKYSFVPLVLDDYEMVDNAIGIKELRKLRVPFYIISVEKLNLDIITEHFENIPVSVEEFASVHGISVEIAGDMLKRSDGNMTRVKMDLQNFISNRDVFFSSKEYVHELTCMNGTGVSKFIDKHLSEHGNTIGIVHENYPDFSNDFVNISQSLSDADLIDMKIYADVSWDLMPYFNISACLKPALYFERPSTENTLRPGSVWTKTSNMLMKVNRLKKLRMPRDHIHMWALRANNGEDVPFESYDLDSINQLSFTKIKPKVLALLKKKRKCQ